MLDNKKKRKRYLKKKQNTQPSKPESKPELISQNTTTITTNTSQLPTIINNISDPPPQSPNPNSVKERIKQFNIFFKDKKPTGNFKVQNNETTVAVKKNFSVDLTNIDTSKINPKLIKQQFEEKFTDFTMIPNLSDEVHSDNSNSEFENYDENIDEDTSDFDHLPEANKNLTN